MKYISLPLVNKFKHYGYNPQAHIGKGSYGQAYLGKDTTKPEKQNLVAIKKVNLDILKQEDDYLYDCVFREIEVQKKTNNPNVLQILDHHKEGKYLYIVLPYCNGGDLGQELLKKTMLPEKEAISILKQIVNGMKELHNNNISHRDLKPDNIFIHDGVYKIADFGFARIFTPQRLMESMVGTPLYESPQILENINYSECTDIWSLGLIYYEMLFGTVPWDCQSIEELVSMIKKQPVRFNFKVQISDQSKDFILKCLQAKEGKRLDFQQVFNHKLIVQQDQNQFVVKQNTMNTLNKKLQNNIYKIQIEYFQKDMDIKQIFKNVDQDNDTQSLNFEEFKMILKEFQQNLSLKDQKELFSIFDEDNSGLISFVEFEKQIFNTSFGDQQQNKMLVKMKADKIIKKIKGFIQNDQITIDQLFQKFSHQTNDFNFQEFSQLIESIDSHFQEEEIKYVFDYFDSDKNKTVSKKEFQTVLNFYSGNLQRNQYYRIKLKLNIQIDRQRIRK